MKKDKVQKAQTLVIMIGIILALYLFGAINLIALIASIVAFPLWLYICEVMKIVNKERMIMKYRQNYTNYHEKRFTATILGKDIEGKIYVQPYGMYLCFSEKNEFSTGNEDVRRWFGYKYRYFAENLTPNQLDENEIINFQIQKDEK